MNLSLTMAVGEKRYGSFALNWCLSVKAANPKAKTALIFTPSAIEGIEEYVHAFFDYTLQVDNGGVENPVELAFKLKTQLYDLALTIMPDAEAYLFMDADTIMLSGRSIDEFFTELKDVEFTMWCNDVYDFATQSRMRDDYTFWCDLKILPQYFEGGLLSAKMPQVNSSFIYFKRTDRNKHIFYLSQAAWHNPQLPHKKYRGVMPDEFCFNLSLCQNKALPHQIPYYPIFFSFASEHFEEQYMRNWKAIGFAGDSKQHEAVVHLYNHNVRYFREMFDVEPFEITAQEIEPVKPPFSISLKCARRTLFRRGEVVNSDGGIFNPDGMYIVGCGFVTIFRKERNHDFYKQGHNQETAIPHLHILNHSGERSIELKYVGKDEATRYEDFRMIETDETTRTFYCSHTVVTDNLTAKMRAGIGISLVDISEQTMTYCGEVKLPIETGKIEKNWVFFSEDGNLYCVYSISPYRLFFSRDGANWTAVSVKSIELNWFHKDVRICNSTRPVLIGSEYLMFFHTKNNGTYYHGAAIINAETKELTHYTMHNIDVPSVGEGWQKGLLYISGLLYIKERDLIQVFAGEGDSHSVRIDYKASDFVGFVKEHTPQIIEFKPQLTDGK